MSNSNSWSLRNGKMRDRARFHPAFFHRRAQTTLFDLSISVILFVGLIVMLFFTISSYNEKIATQSTLSEMELKTYLLSDLFVYTPGFPTGWEYNTSSLEVIGLSDRSHELSTAKVASFQTLSNASYATMKQAMGIEGFDYRLQVKNVSGSVLLAAGTTPAGTYSVSAQRRVIYNGTKAILEFALWL